MSHELHKFSRISTHRFVEICAIRGLIQIKLDNRIPNGKLASNLNKLNGRTFGRFLTYFG